MISVVDVYNYFSTLSSVLYGVTVTLNQEKLIGGPDQQLLHGVNLLHKLMNNVVANDRRIFFIGNGGSAATASHMAIDFTKNGGVPAQAFNDISAITCLANDYGYEHVFSKQIEWYAGADDVVIALSASGRSPNIIEAVEAANQLHCFTVTFTGFNTDNPLRQMGILNFYVENDQYGFVELAHATLLHMVLDLFERQE